MREQDFFERVTGVWLELHNLYEQSQQLSQQIAELEQQGFVNATIHIRKDTGGMELLHPMGSEYEVKIGRRREYVGTKPEQQKVAKERVARYHHLLKLTGEAREVRGKIHQIERAIERLEQVSRNIHQQSFFSMGTNGNSAVTHPVPNVRDISPRGVIDYFKQSPDLAFMADDVEAIFGKTA